MVYALGIKSKFIQYLLSPVYIYLHTHKYKHLISFEEVINRCIYLLIGQFTYSSPETIPVRDFSVSRFLVHSSVSSFLTNHLLDFHEIWQEASISSGKVHNYCSIPVQWFIMKSCPHYFCFQPCASSTWATFQRY